MATKFYLHRSGMYDGGLSAATISTVYSGAANPVVAGGMNPGISLALQTSEVVATSGTTIAAPLPLVRFSSPLLAAQTFSSQQITVQCGFSESNASSGFHLTWVLGVYRPGVGLVGLIKDVPTSSVEAGTSETNVSVTSGGSSTSVTAQDGDVLLLELWRDSTAQAMATVYTNSVYYDGTTEGSSSDNAASLLFTNDVALLPARLVMAGTSLAGTSGGLVTSDDGLVWTLQNAGFGTSPISAIAISSSLSLFVAAGGSGKLATSPDGVVWTSRSSGLTNTISAAVWSSTLSLFVVGGGAGDLAISSNGITWTSQTSNFGANNILGIAWSPSLGLFVAVGSVGTLATSPNGTTWTVRTSGFGTDAINGVAWSPSLSLFVIVGGAGKLSTSANGTSWTSQTSSFGANSINAVTWSSSLSLFTAVGDAGLLETSSTGTSWTARTSGFGTFAYRSVAWSPPVGMFVGAGSNSANKSSDGTSWAPSGYPYFSGSEVIQDVASITTQFSTTRAIADSAGATAVVTRTTTPSARSITGSAPAVDVVTRVVAKQYVVTVSDAVGFTDGIATSLTTPISRSISDTAVASDVVGRGSTRARAIAQAAVATDVVTRTTILGGAYSVTITDLAGFTDASASSITGTGLVTAAVSSTSYDGYSDSLGASATATRTITITPSSSGVVGARASVSRSATIAHTAAGTVTASNLLTVTLSDAIGLVDSGATIIIDFSTGAVRTANVTLTATGTVA